VANPKVTRSQAKVAGEFQIRCRTGNWLNLVRGLILKFLDMDANEILGTSNPPALACGNSEARLLRARKGVS
jgi:hypothetical protein